MAAGVTTLLRLLPSAGVPRPAGAADGLTVLEWAGFRAAVTYTFDDATASQIASYDALQALGVPHEPEPRRGHRCGDAVHRESAGRHRAHDGRAVRTMAAAYGHTQYVDVARTRFLMNRGTGGGQVAPNDSTDRFNLPTFIPPVDAPASAFNDRLDMARTAVMDVA